MQLIKRATPERVSLRMPSIVLLAAILLYMLSACMPIQPEQSAIPASGTPAEGNMETNLPANPVVAQAMQDLAQRLTVPIDQIHVVSSENVTWPDGSLGCSQAGMAYIQVLIDGMRIVLSAEGKSYEYHSGDDRGAFLCTNPQPPVPTDSATR